MLASLLGALVRDASAPMPRPVPVVVRGSQATRPLELAEIRAMTARNSSAIASCYERAGAIARRVVVQLTIDADGSIENLWLDDHASGALGACLAGEISAWQFRAAGARVMVKLPLVFRAS